MHVHVHVNAVEILNRSFSERVAHLVHASGDVAKHDLLHESQVAVGALLLEDANTQRSASRHGIEAQFSHDTGAREGGVEHNSANAVVVRHASAARVETESFD